MRRVWRRRALAFLLLLAVLLPTGCWDLREVEELGLVMAFGIRLPDRGEGYEIWVQEANPGGGAQQIGAPGKEFPAPFHNHQGLGRTVFDAVRLLSRETPHRLFFSHNQVFIIGERLARQHGVGEVLDFLERDPEFRRTVWILVLRSRLMPRLFNTVNSLNQPLGQYLAGVLLHRHLSSTYAPLRLGDFVQYMNESGIDAFTAGVELKTPAQSQQQGMAQSTPQLPVPRLNQTAVFRRDRLAGWLDAAGGRGLLYVRGEADSGIITLNYRGREVALEITNNQSSLRAELNKDRPRFIIDVQVDCNVGESMAAVNLADVRVINEIKELARQQIRRDIARAISRCQELGSDPFGFGRHLAAQHPAYWQQVENNWREGIFPAAEFIIQPQVKIRRLGLITQGFKAR
ncbi:Ger(x)C family spore germination protein [Desulfurispora thermophila]|uniref:Ger(x)C family spore germination protein n=1 Tax=Desulfurispora thermophila TaxID=265470 RepID=UPI00036896CF|nr:Ger(x)C family spore germination protein [Desulfurispora thermophila]